MFTKSLHFEKLTEMLQFVHICVARGRSSVGRGNFTKCLQLMQLLTDCSQKIYGKFINETKIYNFEIKNLQSVHNCKIGAQHIKSIGSAPAFTQNLQIVYNCRKCKFFMNNRATRRGRRGLSYLFLNLRTIFFQRGTRTTPQRRR